MSELINSVCQTYLDIRKLKKIKLINNFRNYDEVLSVIKKNLEYSKVTKQVHYYAAYFILNKILKIPDSKINSIITLFDTNDIFFNLLLDNKLVINNPISFLISIAKSNRNRYFLYDNRVIKKIELIKFTFFKYKVPNNLIRLYINVTYSNFYNKTFKTIFSNALINLMFSISCGKSLFDSIKEFSIENNPSYSFPLFTKKECHNYLFDADDTVTFSDAIKKSIIYSNGGSKKLIEHLEFGDDRFYDRLFNKELNIKKYKIIKWFCKIEFQIKESIYYTKIPAMFTFLMNNLDDKKFSLQGKTFDSVLKQISEQEKIQIKRQYHHLPQQWEKSTIPNFSVSLPKDITSEHDAYVARILGNQHCDIYTITEILNIDDLYSEGNELCHCVLTYMNRIFDPCAKLTFWSLKINKKRLLTIALNAKNNVYSIRGFGNRLAKDDELKIIKMWTDKIELLTNPQLQLFQ